MYDIFIFLVKEQSWRENPSSDMLVELPHHLIKDELVNLFERTFQREGSLCIACNDRNAFFTSDAVRNYNLWSC